MKNILLMIFLALGLILTGCSKQEISVLSTPALLHTPETTPAAIPNTVTINPEATSERKGILAGRLVCIDPGHGNPNHEIKYEQQARTSSALKPATAYGTTGVLTKIPEYKLTMQISLKLRDRLVSQGANVILTRENNEQDLGNIERAEIGNRAAADIAVRLHADGVENPSVSGISVLYPGGQYIDDQKLLEKSRRAAKLVLDGLISNTNAKSRNIIERNDLTGFNWSTIPVILVETGFMTNPEEDKLLNSDEYQDKICDGIVKGLIAFFESE